MKTQTTAIIRERGQLTIPNFIREVFAWVAPNSIVTIIAEKPDEIVIQPHRIRQTLVWSNLWERIKLSRSFKGKKGNLSEFISEDRKRH